MSLFDFLKDPLRLQQVGGGLEVGARILGGLSHLDYAQQVREAGGYQAEQLQINAGQAQAASQYAAADVDRRTKLLASRALAVAASSGGGASDPTVVNAIAGIASEGAYRRAVAIYQGDDAARRLEMQAESTEYEAKNRSAAEKRAAYSGFLGAGTSLLKGTARSSSLRAKYGGNGPNLAPSDDQSNEFTSDY